jgi:ABC-type nitrate/sulfonate/bicarbonate transport system permease component
VTSDAQAEPSAPRRVLRRGARFGRGVLTRWGFTVLFVAVWEVAVKTGFIDYHFFPAPTALMRALWADIVSGKLASDSLGSFGRVVAGLAIGVTVGVIMGLAMAMSRLVDAMFSLPVQVLRAIPPITWIGFAILWFGLGSRPAIFLIFLGVVFPILISTYAGVRQVDLIYLRAARNLGARGWMLFRDVVLLAAMPSILTGLRVSVGLAWILMVVGELIAVPSGLGATLLRAQDYDQTDRMLAYMLVIGFYGYLSDIGVNRMTRRLLRWQRRAGE